MTDSAREFNVYVRHTLDVLRAQGVDVAPLLDKYGIDERALDGPQDQVSRELYSRLLDEIIRPADQAEAIYQLLGPAFKKTTGAVIHVDLPCSRVCGR